MRTYTHKRTHTGAHTHARKHAHTNTLHSNELDAELPDEELVTLAEALSAMVPPGARTQPVQPDDLLMVLPLFVAESVGV